MENEPVQPTPSSTPEPTPGAASTPPPPAQPATGGPQGGGTSDKKLVSGILGILLGSLGIHKFYLGYQKEGIIMLVIGVVGWFLCGIPTAVVAVIGLIEGILYLTKPDEEFERVYVTGRKPWF